MKWRTVLRDLVPPLALRGVRRVQSRLLPWTLAHSCPVCRRRVDAFLPLSPRYDEKKFEYGCVLSPYLAETMNRRQYACPYCKATDRDRLYALFVARQAEAGRLPALLDIAPSKPLSRFLVAQGPLAYRTADLSMSGVDDLIDITDMSGYEDASFGAILCSHVLEHVPDDRKAMRELYRVLAPGGWAILMVPINLGLDEISEDPTITDPGLRWKYFGQDDHVRVYSKQGFKDRLTEAGFEVSEYGAEDFEEGTFRRCGITERSVLYVGWKRTNPE